MSDHRFFVPILKRESGCSPYPVVGLEIALCLLYWLTKASEEKSKCQENYIVESY